MYPRSIRKAQPAESIRSTLVAGWIRKCSPRFLVLMLATLALLPATSVAQESGGEPLERLLLRIIEQNGVETAVGEYPELREQRHDSGPGTLRKVAEALASQGGDDLERAIHVMEFNLDFHPDYIEGYEMLGSLHVAAGEWAEALEVFERGLEFDPDNEQLKQQVETLRSRMESSPPEAPDRFKDNGDGTVTDTNTGLIWLKDASCGELPGTDEEGRANWETAKSAAAALASGMCGLGEEPDEGWNWRLPTIEEFCSAWDRTWKNLTLCPADAASTSLLDSSLSAGPYGPYVPNATGTGLWEEGDAFVGVLQVGYWTPSEISRRFAWCAGLEHAKVAFCRKDYHYVVWPVREPPPRFVDNGDGTVRDTNTGLIWLKDADCLELTDGERHNYTEWPEAKMAVAALASGTCGLRDGSKAGDWRLPKIEEFCSAWVGEVLNPCPASAASTSLIDSSLGERPYVPNAAGRGIWTDGNAFHNLLWGAGEDRYSWTFWSATGWDPTHAWAANLNSGTVDRGCSGGCLFNVWPVRSGQ